MEHKKMWILYLEDELGLLEVFSHFVEEDLPHASLIKCPTILSFRRVARKVIPDIIITDINLPDGFGHEAVQDFINRVGYIPVIVTSSIDISNERPNWYHMNKPFRNQDLISLIQDIQNRQEICRTSA
jgi:DNA-binding NtrC family response regulator